jgi:hypothetical protein
MTEQLAGAMGISPEWLLLKACPILNRPQLAPPTSSLIRSLAPTSHPYPQPRLLKPWLKQAHNRKPSHSKAG